MTEKEAKEHLEARLECMTREMAVGFDERCDKNCDECNLLYAQGTIGEIKETYKMGIKALEKQIAKKPELIEGKMWTCPCCDNHLMHKWLKYPTELMPLSEGLPYCMACGQKISWDWGNEDAE